MRKLLTWLLLVVSLASNTLLCNPVYADTDTTGSITGAATEEQTVDTVESDSEGSASVQSTDLATQVSTLSTAADDIYNVDYNKYFIAPFSYRNNVNEYISPSTGSLIIKNTDVFLPGRNGHNLELTTTYNSSDAYFYYAYWTMNSYGDERNGHNNLTDQRRHFSIGSGWTFNISYLRIVRETKSTDDDTTDDQSMEVHLGSGETYYATRGSYDTEYDFEEYDAKDIVLVKDSSYSESGSDTVVDGTTDGLMDTQNRESKYALKYKDGRTEYFNESGYLICIMDRYGNRIRYGYIQKKFLDAYYYFLPYKIEDSLGRIVKINYCGSDSSSKYVDIILPDGVKKIHYNLDSTMNYAISKRTDQQGRSYKILI